MSTTTNTPTIAQKPRINTVTLVQLALLSALIIVLASTPLGYINLGFISATTIHIPVILGAILLGPKAGAFLGFIFGLTSMVKATIQPNLTSFAFSPFYSVGETSGNFWSLVVCFVPRILIGIVAAYVFIWVSKLDKTKVAACALAGFLGSMTNTILVMGFIYIFFGPAYAHAQGLETDALFGAIMTVVGGVGVPEAIAAAVLSALIGRALLSIYKKAKLA